MKHLRKIFENNNEETKKYIEDCLLDISENPNFEVDDLLEVDVPESVGNPMSIYKLHIELGKSITLPQPINSNLYIGKVETSLEFLRMKNEKLNELYDDIEVAIERIKDKFDYRCAIKIEANRRDEIDILVVIAKN